MKKLLPFIFPLTSLAIVLFLAFRWYSHRTDRGSITQFAENVAIEELSQEDTISALRGVGDYESVDLKGENGVTGKLRYEIADGKVRFSVTADLENSPGTNYQVWLKDPDSEAIRKAFPLEYMKGGMSGTAAISAETLPFEVLVSKDSVGATAPTEILLKGLVEDRAEAGE